MASCVLPLGHKGKLQGGMLKADFGIIISILGSSNGYKLDSLVVALCLDFHPLNPRALCSLFIWMLPEGARVDAFRDIFL